MSQAFDSVVVRKPRASRDRSSEFYLLARGLRAA
jgi:23S rRNA U2552 (ribose-2'-O)-methylase RlmE/FtsJ